MEKVYKQQVAIPDEYEFLSCYSNRELFYCLCIDKHSKEKAGIKSIDSGVTWKRVWTSKAEDIPK